MHSRGNIQLVVSLLVSGERKAVDRKNCGYTREKGKMTFSPIFYLERPTGPKNIFAKSAPWG